MSPITRAQSRHPGRFDYATTQYEAFTKPVVITCVTHGVFRTTPKAHLYTNCGGCRRCIHKPKLVEFGLTQRLSFDEFLTRARAKHGDRYDYSQAVYTTFNAKLTVICPKHGDFSIAPDKHLAGRGCRQCANEKLSRERRLRAWTLIERIVAVHGLGRYDYDLRGYVNRHSRLRIRCHKHGWFQQTANNHLQGHACPKCASSRGENRIREVLRLLGLDFCEQVRFPHCRDRRPLSFDFYLPHLRTLIEYDGTQHFYKSELWGGHHLLEHTQRHDAIKNQFAAEYGYRLIRIPYWEFDNIETILQNEFASVPQGVA